MTITRRTALASAAALSLPLVGARAGRWRRVLRIGVGSSLAKLDPMLTTIGDEYIYDNLVFNGLTRMAEDQTVEPDLAERWKYSDDLKRWTFHLRQGVKFHDGTEMSSDDVVAVLQAPARHDHRRAVAQQLRHGRRRCGAGSSTPSCSRWTSPYGGFADILSDRQVKIVPRGKVAQLATQPIGTGPFRFLSYTPGDRMVLAKIRRLFRAGDAEAGRRRAAHHSGDERQARGAAVRRAGRGLGPAARPGEADVAAGRFAGGERRQRRRGTRRS